MFFFVASKQTEKRFEGHNGKEKRRTLIFQFKCQFNSLAADNPSSSFFRSFVSERDSRALAYATLVPTFFWAKSDNPALKYQQSTATLKVEARVFAQQRFHSEFFIALDGVNHKLIWCKAIWT